MAYITGTATDHVDLWDTLLDFLQNNTDLVAAGQAWTVEWSHPTLPSHLLKGPGLSGTDEVFIGLHRSDQPFQPDESLLYLTGATGVIPGATDYHAHVNGLARRPNLFLDHGTMQYWMVASGRRFVVVVKISTIYQACYGGFFLPYAAPSNYPCPLFIGGTRGYDQHSSTSGSPVTSWRDGTLSSYRHFAYPWSHDGTYWYDSTAFLLDPAGDWLAGTYNYTGDTYALPFFILGPRAFPPYLSTARPRAATGNGFDDGLTSDGRLGYAMIRERLQPGLDGEVSLTPVTLMRANYSSAPDPVTYGILDGVFSVAGSGVVAEDLVTLNGVDHLVVANVGRTAVDEYWALALE